MHYFIILGLSLIDNTRCLTLNNIANYCTFGYFHIIFKAFFTIFPFILSYHRSIG